VKREEADRHATSVLVAYGTANGSTAQIAEAVAEVLRKGDSSPTCCLPGASWT
jgi:hypothetical protein